MDRSRLAVVIPAVDESKSIGPIIAEAALYGLPIVVDDGSSDSTGDVALRAGADVVRHTSNLGYDRALESGFARAVDLQCAFVITLDADGQHDPSLLSTFAAELDRGADIVIGVRDRRQRISERLFGYVAGRLWSIHDPLCGMKGYRLAVYQRLGHFDSYRSIGTELAIFGARSGCVLREVSVKTRPRPDASRFGWVIKANWRIFRALCLSLRPQR